MQNKNSMIDENYRPSVEEGYMNEKQLSYFKYKLLAWKKSLCEESIETIEHLQRDNINAPDMGDRATIEEEHALELRTRDRYRKLIAKIDAALQRIEDGSYGYCVETGEEIGIKRLEARPIATLSIEAQERYENHERTHSDDDE